MLDIREEFLLPKIPFIYHGILHVTVSVTISVKVRKDIVDLADKMVRYGIARSRSHAINIMIERGIERAKEEVERWERIYRSVKRLRKEGYRMRRGDLWRLLQEGRSR